MNGAAISHRSSGAQVRIMASSTEADHARAERSSK
ncbi:hypothetical protein M2302_005795 [Micromonospora sp. A200]|nr:hypothetical protein [Micromonospora sp. A200]